MIGSSIPGDQAVTTQMIKNAQEFFGNWMSKKGGGAMFSTNTMVSNLSVHTAVKRLDRTSDASTMWLSKKDHEAIVAHPMELLPRQTWPW